MVAVLNWLLNHWWIGIWLAIFGVFGAVRDFFVSIAEAIGGAVAGRHERKLELAQASRPVTAPQDTQPAPVPGRCAHRRVKQVRDVNDELVAWLCMGCDTRLPADWAIAEEDL